MSTATKKLFTEITPEESTNINGGVFSMAIDPAALFLAPMIGGALGITGSALGEFIFKLAFRTRTTYPGWPGFPNTTDTPEDL